MAWDSLAEWSALSARAGLPIFHPCGILFFFEAVQPYLTQTIEVHERLKLPTQTLDRKALAKRFPMFDFSHVEIGLYEPDFGALMARRAVQTLVAEYRAGGGSYLQAQIAPPELRDGPLGHVITNAGERIEAEQFVFACGPWLPKLFPDLLADRIFPTRQEVFFFSPPAGDPRFGPASMPGWVDFNHGDMFYGVPDLEGRGVKIAHDRHGPRIDPDLGDREASAASLAHVRAYMERRFPALAGRPLNETRVCQYENSANGDFLIDRHPSHSNVVLVGAGSGHGFKHGPAVGRYAAQLVSANLPRIEPRFSLASKGEQQNRAVH
jgi:glycine/D-amino acid oxidase-like deaminating enzyme